MDKKINIDIEEVRRLRQQKLSCRKIAKLFNTNHVSISKLLRDNGESSEQFKHSFDKDFFKIIDSQEKAYCLGLIFSDGFVQHGRVGLNMTDRDVLEKFKKALSYSGEIRTIQPKKPTHKVKYEVNIFSVEMFRDVSRYGIVPNKSLTLKFPEHDLIPPKLLSHFIRGIFDGDGSLFVGKDKQWKIVFTGTKDICEGLMSATGIPGKIRKVRNGKKKKPENFCKNTYHYRIGVKDDIDYVLNWMYKDASLYMDRKYRSYRKCTVDPTLLHEKIREALNAKGCNFSISENYPETIFQDNLHVEYISFLNNLSNKYCYRQRRKFNAIQKSYIAIFEHEWTNRQRQIVNFISKKTGRFKTRVFARKCSVAEIPKPIAVNFIRDNHIQPVGNGGIINIGLYEENKLLGLLQLRKHHRSNKDITISRICFEEGYLVVGGFSRLVNAAAKYASEYGYDKILTWSDNRLTNGEAYEKNGFTKEHTFGSDYAYIKGNEYYSKQSMRKSATGCPADVTESLWMEGLGYKKIWDCGKTRWVYEIKKEGA